MNKKLIVGVPVLLLILGGGAWLYGQSVMTRVTQPSVPLAMQATTTPVIGLVTASPNLITVNTPTVVTMTVQITDPTVLPTGVNLLRLNASGTPTVLGVMRDDGLNGDVVANDKVFSLHLNFHESTSGQVQLQASAAFKGILKRVQSPPSLISVWIIQNTHFGVILAHPPQLVLTPFEPSPVSGDFKAVYISEPNEEISGSTGMTLTIEPNLTVDQASRSLQNDPATKQYYTRQTNGRVWLVYIYDGTNLGTEIVAYTQRGSDVLILGGHYSDTSLPIFNGIMDSIR